MNATALADDRLSHAKAAPAPPPPDQARARMNFDDVLDRMTTPDAADATQETSAAVADARLFRLVVHSAGEAMRAIGRDFGGAARVVSVRTLPARGALAWLFARPRIEVLVETPRTTTTGEKESA